MPSRFGFTHPAVRPLPPTIRLQMPIIAVRLASRWSVPTLLMYAGADRLVDPAGSRAFAAAAPRDRVAAQCFDDLYHEIFNEVDAEPVFGRMKEWLDGRW